MATRCTLPPRTPSPKIRIHRSQSFDSPSSRFSTTPIEDSPYSKSTSAISKPLPRCNARKSFSLRTKMSDDSLQSDASSSSSSSIMSHSSDTLALFSGSPAPASRPPRRMQRKARTANKVTMSDTMHPPPEILGSSLAFSIYQDPTVPMYDPWLVRVVLDMYDIRRFDWMMIAEPIERIWGFKTSSAEVLGILSGNGRVGRRWWD